MQKVLSGRPQLSLQLGLSKTSRTTPDNTSWEAVAAATVTTKLCQVSTGRCIDGAAPDGQQHLPGVAPSVRVGHHAVDRSYVQFFVGPVPGVPANISIEYSVTDSPGAGDGSGSAVAGDRAQILLLATLQRGGEEQLAMDGRVIRTPLSIFQS